MFFFYYGKPLENCKSENRFQFIEIENFNQPLELLRLGIDDAVDILRQYESQVMNLNSDISWTEY